MRYIPKYAYTQIYEDITIFPNFKNILYLLSNVLLNMHITQIHEDNVHILESIHHFFLKRIYPKNILKWIEKVFRNFGIWIFFLNWWQKKLV